LPSGERRECSVDFAVDTGLHDVKLSALHLRRFLHLFNHAFRIGVARVHHQSDYPSLRSKLGNHLKPLGHQLH
jgi:hypothetical protein